MNGDFIWTDLSAYDLKGASAFYKHCLGWQYQKQRNGYSFALVNNTPSSAIFPMPDKFQKIQLPSFWMSYIHVDDIQQTVDVARQLGAIIEVEPESDGNDGLIALIRDPAGAGFTCYQGNDLQGRDATGTHGRMVWNELHVSDVNTIKSFYETLFNWTIQPSSTPNRYDIINQGKAISAVEILTNEIKGNKEYWAVYFAVENLDNALAKVTEGSGEIGAKFESPLGKTALIYDPWGAACLLVETERNQSTMNTQTGSTFKWRTILGLILVVAAIVFNLNWVWGIFFLMSVIPDLFAGSTYFLEPIHRTENPLLFWSIMIIWIGLSLYSLSSLFT